MKKFMAITLSLGLVVAAQAQLEVGLKAGVNLASQSTNIDGADYGSTTGLYLGIPVRYYINDNLVFQPEIAFMQKGSSFDFETSVPGFFETKVESDGKLNYVEIPLMVQYLIGDGDIQPFVQAGPSIGIGMGTKSTGTSTTTVTDPFTGSTTTETEDFDDSGSFEDAGLSGIDFGFGIGAGAVMEAGPGDLSLNLLYNLGFANILDADTAGDNKINNRGLAIMLGFVLPIN
ncbi:MAG: hypothetical protein ABR95_00660 [Sphingobacteriales bacterium BACL12 MAG-120813-bin55]|jgi:hypothetical protein|nr:MAG: hypothetical protein ABR94_02790 [Sphingobacteriales bacterium BACL12 MAG-120802-bin5]KRP10598.1 MAG: hypothetical protein ABR95_00660 [Sphingobacteriales bacterium BACL12 MAG-120813-bin55]